MAVRTITTRLALDGEAAYKAKIKNINAELSLHKSELAKVQAQYKNQANSTEALGAKYSALKAQLVDLHKKHTQQEKMLEKAQETSSGEAVGLALLRLPEGRAPPAGDQNPFLKRTTMSMP